MAHISVPGPPSGTVPDPRVTVHWHVNDEQFVVIALAYGKAESDVKVFTDDEGLPRFRTLELEVDGQPVMVFGAAHERATVTVSFAAIERPAPAAPVRVAA